MEKAPRIILKLTGELFGDGDNSNISFARYDQVAQTLIEIRRQIPLELAMVPGGGNIFRGRQADSKVDHVTADLIGMMATLQNGAGLREALIRNGETTTRLMTNLECAKIGEPYLIEKARHHLAEGRMVIIGGGLGMPGFTTDSAVAQFAADLQCRMVLKASTVDGVYDCDPRANPQARRFQRVTFDDALKKDLNVMDATAFAMCRRSQIPIFVFDVSQLHRIPEIIRGDYSFGTLITDAPNPPVVS